MLLCYFNNNVTALCENYGLRSSNNIHNASRANVRIMQVFIGIRNDLELTGHLSGVGEKGASIATFWTVNGR